MRRSPQLHYGNHGLAGRDGAIPAPHTPHGPRKGSDLNDLISSLENKWVIGLRRRSEGWSDTKRPNDLQDKIYGQLQFLFFQARPLLDDIIDEFTEIMSFCPRHEGLKRLHNLLKEKKHLPTSDTGRSSNHRPKILTPSSAKYLHSGEFRSDHGTNRYPAPGQEIDPIDTGSATDEEDTDFYTPPSPSRSAAQRRGQAEPVPSNFSTPSKRRSSDVEGAERSPKYAKTPSGKCSPQKPKGQDSTGLKHCVQAMFKEPARPMINPIFRPVQSASTSKNTSFNSIWSQETLVNSAATSFSTDGASDRAFYKGDNSIQPAALLTRQIATSAPMEGIVIGPQGKHKQERIPSQEAGQDCAPSTYGTVYEEEFGQATDKIELDLRTASASGSGLLTVKDDVPSNVRSAHPHPNSGDGRGFPVMESCQIRDMPKQNLFQGRDCVVEPGLPFMVRFICQRIILEHNLKENAFENCFREPSSYSTSENFWDTVSKITDAIVVQTRDNKVNRLKVRLTKSEGSRVWRSQQDNCDGYTFKAQLSLNYKESEPVFTLQVLPIKADRSCRLQRKFGAHRFLYIHAPTFGDRKGRFQQTQMQQISVRWREWLDREHYFCGRRWKAFHVEPVKKKGKKRQGVTHDKRVVMFAISGCGISNPLSVGSMLNWFIPFSKNGHQTVCKAFARIDLALSRTVPTHVFQPSQIRYIRDIKSNGELEATEFNDTTLKWPLPPANQVMTDGCARISVGAARRIWNIYRDTMGIDRCQSLPTAFQGRIGGAKGMWFVSGETFSNSLEDHEIWIEVSDSQLKLIPHDEDSNVDAYDSLRLTFEVRNCSTMPSASELHIAFIPILLDRGVPEHVIISKMKTQLDADRVTLLQALKDPARTYEWIHKNGSKSHYGVDLLWQAALPMSNEEKIKLMLESGFFPTESAYVAKVISRFIQKYHMIKESKMRIPLGKSTMVYGIADPHKVLKPGEVQMRFSSQFVAELAEEGYLDLNRMEVLVSRQPACRRSDVQKVRAVTHPKLSHLRDVIVFPSVGEYPLAGMLQGGDYDGDMFWLCWEAELVEPFKNAPAPVVPPVASEYGIKVDKTKLEAVVNVNDPSNVDKFLHQAFGFRSVPSLLGKLTILLETIAYQHNIIHSKLLERLCDMHDLLVDASKQGYTFTDADYDELIKKLWGSLARQDKPAYKAAMEDCAETNDVDKARRKVATEYKGHRRNRALDRLYFDEFRAHNIETARQVSETFSKALSSNEYKVDEALVWPYNYQKSKNDPVIDEELRKLAEQLRQDLNHKWNGFFNREGTAAQANTMMLDLYDAYLAIQPSQPEHPSIKPWLEETRGPGQTLWNAIKASTLYKIFPWPGKAEFVFKMAGEELTRLKALSFERSRCITPAIYANMKPKKIKSPVEQDLEEAEEVEEEGEGEDDLG